MGYHKKAITKGRIGEISKIEEELEELKDAVEQNAKIMELVEISDLILAIELYLNRYHPSTSLGDVLKMKELTKGAFKDGSRR